MARDAAKAGAPAGVAGRKTGAASTPVTVKKGRTSLYVSPLAVARNVSDVAWARTLMAVITGLVAGICGVTGVAGFVTYFVSHAVVSAALLARLRCKAEEFLPQTTNLSFVFGGAGDNVLLFIVFWALSYAGLWVF